MMNDLTAFSILPDLSIQQALVAALQTNLDRSSMPIFTVLQLQYWAVAYCLLGIKLRASGRTQDPSTYIMKVNTQ